MFTGHGAESTGDEQAAALEASLNGMADSAEPTIFDKIISRQVRGWTGCDMRCAGSSL
jgi:hypothetical protein